MLGKTEGRRRKMAGNEMVEWHHRLNGLNGHEFEKTLGDSRGQRHLAHCSPWSHKELNMTQQLSDSRRVPSHTRCAGRAPVGGHAVCFRLSEVF